MYEGLDPEFLSAAHGCVAIVARVPSHCVENAVGIYSSFWVEVSDRHFLITASHVIERSSETGSLNELEAAHPDAKFTLRPAVGGRSSETLFNYRTAQFFTAQRLAEELPDLRPEVKDIMVSTDVGAIALTDLYISNLRATGARPYSLRQVRELDADSVAAISNETTRLSAHVVGVPVSTNQVHADELLFECHFLKLPLFPLGVEGRTILWEPTWSDDELPHDVRGCSGGPIIVTGLDRLFIAGVQYAQEKTPSGLVIKSVDVTPFIAFLEIWARVGPAP